MMLSLCFWILALFVLYVYAGYPIAVTLLASLRPKPGASAAPAAFPSVTVLIPAHNEEKVIGGKLGNTLALDYPSDHFQIIVAADGSDDGTVDIVKTYADRGVELSYHPTREGRMAAINRALPLARGDIIVLSNVRCMCYRTALRELVAPFRHHLVGIVSGTHRITRDEDASSAAEATCWKYESFLWKQEARFGCCTGVSNEILAVRRNLFEQPPDNVVYDGFFMAMQIVRRGYNMDYAPNAFSVERGPDSMQEERARRAKQIAGRYQAAALAAETVSWRRPVVAWEVVSHHFLRLFAPFAAIGVFLASLLTVVFPSQTGHGGLLLLASPFNWIAFAPQVVFYAWALIGNSFQNRSPSYKALYFPSYLVKNGLSVLIGVCRSLAGKSPSL
ncbi:MAG TPA: glycosyltransferase family 2 protein [Sumerlaeia bacterium]|nr:glycosyltransferase family 2 protein [Sumerlaeia bacterium]